MTLLLASPNIDFEQQIKPLLEIQSRNGNTPLDVLAFHNPSEFIKLIMQLLARPEIDFDQKIKPLLEIQDRDGKTPLHRLARHKTSDFIELMMQLLASPEIDLKQKIKPLLEIQDRDGNTPLTLLADKNPSKFIELMIRLLANTSIEFQNYTPALQVNSNQEEFVTAVNAILSLYFQHGESALNSAERPFSQGTTFFSQENNSTEVLNQKNENEKNR